jgi:hypothetical protein
MRNVTGPIGIGFSGPTNNNSNNNEQNTPKPFIRNIVFNAIRATVVSAPVNHPDIHFGISVRDGEKNSCITLNAMGDYYLENISFTDVHVKYGGGGTAEQASKVVPNEAAEYFGVWNHAPGGPPAYGMYARNVKGLTLQNVRLEYEEPDARPAIIFDNVQDASINNLSAKGSENIELLRFINSKDILLTGTRLLSTSSVFLLVQGSASGNITVSGGDIQKAKQSLAVDKGADKSAVRMLA